MTFYDPKSFLFSTMVLAEKGGGGENHHCVKAGVHAPHSGEISLTPVPPLPKAPKNTQKSNLQVLLGQTDESPSHGVHHPVLVTGYLLLTS